MTSCIKCLHGLYSDAESRMQRIVASSECGGVYSNKTNYSPEAQKTMENVKELLKSLEKEQGTCKIHCSFERSYLRESVVKAIKVCDEYSFHAYMHSLSMRRFREFPNPKC